MTPNSDRDPASTLQRQQEMYASSDGAVRSKGFDVHSAHAYYANYLAFVAWTCPAGGRLLDVGCGSGWSSYLLAQTGRTVVGLDLNPAAFEAPADERLELRPGSATDIPFEANSFDVVATHQALEHMPEPKRALVEMVRVLKPGGVVCVLTPNLLSLLALARGAGQYVWRNRPRRRILFRDADMPRHPFGNTLPEIFVQTLVILGRIARKSLRREAEFTMREPDLRPPFFADNDACYVANPIDLVKFFRSAGCEIIQKGMPGRPPMAWLLATGAYVAARKPTAT